MIVFINSKSLADVIAGRATSLIASPKAGVVANEQALYTADEISEMNGTRIATALEALAEYAKPQTKEKKK